MNDQLAAQLFNCAKELSPSMIDESDGLFLMFKQVKLELTYYSLGDEIQFILKPRGTRYARYGLKVSRKAIERTDSGKFPEADRSMQDIEFDVTEAEMAKLMIEAIGLKIKETSE